MTRHRTNILAVAVVVVMTSSMRQRCRPTGSCIRRPRAILTAKGSGDVVSQGMAFSGTGDSLFVISTLPKSDGVHILSILPV